MNIEVGTSITEKLKESLDNEFRTYRADYDEVHFEQMKLKQQNARIRRVIAEAHKLGLEMLQPLSM